ncbi:hypothetical protein F2Q68_00007685 [Brassica cretica]|uniref:FBD domain-containing protein n=1 Tax=Brassica cretica TaxID=69181 RepID=A0A8S9KZJ9_BRACR|nr:hypothetical protein F2Q68_00007685 [Brassica cretica]
MRRFDNIYADIGDEQSLLQSLSIFSGHLKQISVGARTNPLEGAALGMEILESFVESGSLLTMATTHHGELKMLKYRFLEKSCLNKLKLKILKRKNNKPCVMRWVDFVARRKLIKHVDVEYIYVSRKRLEVMPVSLYVCETLLYLRLNRVFVGSLDSVSLPYLKTMRLEENMYDSDAGIESLISSCPVLEDLNIVRRLDDNVRVLRVHSQTITSRVEHDCGCDHAFFCFEWETLALFIDAPRLNLEAEVCLRHLDILGMLPTFLESFPNLKSIVLVDLTHSKTDTLPIALSSVPPQCLLSSLEFVEIKSRYEAEFVLMELANYFAKNSVILKKLVVRWKRSKLEEDTVLWDLLSLPWGSSTCRIEVCGPLKRLVV